MTGASGGRPADPREVFLSVRKRPRSRVWFGTYLEACAFVMGYSTGLGGDFLDSFQRWVAGRTGLGRVVAFWHHIPPAIFPEMPSPDPRSFSHQEDAQAVDTLFTWLLEYLDETAAAGIAPADPEPERGA